MNLLGQERRERSERHEVDLAELTELASSQGLDQALYWHCQAVFGKRPQDISGPQLRQLTDDFLPVIVDLMIQKRMRRKVQ